MDDGGFLLHLRNSGMQKVLTLMLTVLILGGCAQREKPKPAAREGDEILDFTAPKLGGGQVVGSEFAGKDVALWFWAPW